METHVRLVVGAQYGAILGVAVFVTSLPCPKGREDMLAALPDNPHLDVYFDGHFAQRVWDVDRTLALGRDRLPFTYERGFNSKRRSHYYYCQKN